MPRLPCVRHRKAATLNLTDDLNHKPREFVHVKLDNGEQVPARGLGDDRVSQGDPVFLTPEQNRIHRFDQVGLAVAA